MMRLLILVTLTVFMAGCSELDAPADGASPPTPAEPTISDAMSDPGPSGPMDRIEAAVEAALAEA